MKWLKLKTLTSMRLAWGDTVHLARNRLAFPLIINILAALIALAASHKVIALWSLVAVPACAVLAWPAFLIRRQFFCWTRLWKATNNVAPGMDGAQINSALKYADTAKLLTDSLEVECSVTDPAGTTYKENYSVPAKFAQHASYPGLFKPAGPVVPGDYIVVWRERRPAATGRWRVVTAGRVTVTAADLEWPPAADARSAPAVGAGT